MDCFKPSCFEGPRLSILAKGGAGGLLGGKALGDKMAEPLVHVAAKGLPHSYNSEHVALLRQTD